MNLILLFIFTTKIKYLLIGMSSLMKIMMNILNKIIKKKLFYLYIIYNKMPNLFKKVANNANNMFTKIDKGASNFFTK